MIYEILLILVQCFRLLAIVAGILVAVESYKILVYDIEHEFCHKKNSFAWLWMGIACFSGGALLILNDEPTVTFNSGYIGLITVLWIWFSLCAVLLVRASMISKNSKFIWIASSVFIVSGLILKYKFGV